MLSALDQVRLRNRSSYLRLTSKRVDQGLMKVPDDSAERERLRRQVLNGAYRLIDRSGRRGYSPDSNVVHVLACGAMIPEAVAASNALLEEGIFANVVNVTGLGPLYRSFQQSVYDAMDGAGTLGKFMADSIAHGLPTLAHGDRGGRSSALARVDRQRAQGSGDTRRRHGVRSVRLQ